MREFRLTARTGKTRIWKIGVLGDQVLTEFGEEGGVMQSVTDTAQEKNVGRSNHVSSQESALQQMERQILLKQREGYVEVFGDAPTEVRQGDEIRFDRSLPNNLAFYKPDNTLTSALEKKLEAKKAWLARKRDGEMMVIVKDTMGLVSIYSRRMLLCHDKEQGTGWEWKHRFAHIADAIEAAEQIPNETILLGEMVSGIRDDERWHVASVMKSLTPRAMELQEGAPLWFYVWDIAYVGGVEWLSKVSVGHRYQTIFEWFGFVADGDGVPFCTPVEVFYADTLLNDFPLEDCKGFASYNPEHGPVWNAACAFALESEWEGFVAVDPEGVFGDRAFNFRGKPDRPGQFSGKIKPEYEMDAVVHFDPENKVGKWGRGKYQGQVGAVALYQYDTKGKLVYICECGGGITEEFRAKYQSPEDFPIVAIVRYTNRTYISEGDATNALQFPRIISVREDKAPEECIEERLDVET